MTKPNLEAIFKQLSISPHSYHISKHDIIKSLQEENRNLQKENESLREQLKGKFQPQIKGVFC